MTPTLLLTLIVFLPAAGAVLLAFIPAKAHDALRGVTLAITLAVLGLCLLFLLGEGPTKFEAAGSQLQNLCNLPWIPSFDIYYFMGMDGISFPLVMLTAVVSVLAMGASWSITKYIKAYCILFLLLETGMLGVFLALDFFLFYVFWEVMLLPMYFLIGVWGGPRREYAAIKFFLYTLVGSVLMLVAILLLYFYSDLRELAKVSDLGGDAATAKVQWSTLNLPPNLDARIGRKVTVQDPTRADAALELLRTDAHPDRPLAVEFVRAGESTTATYDEASNRVTVQMANGQDTAARVAAAIQENPLVSGVIRARAAQGLRSEGVVLPADSVIMPAINHPVHTFSIPALTAIGQHTNCFNDELLWGWTLQHWAFVLLFIGFIVKVPSVPLHTWLPDAHVEAPTPISMILAGVLLKMGGYGIIRICYPICPLGGYDFAYVVCLIGVVSMVYGAFAALAQKDFKRMVAYSSVSHMGYVVLGLGVWSARDFVYNSDFWNMGVQGAMFQMIAHGISSTGMFFMVGVIYDRVHHRNLDEFGGLFGKMPVYTALSIGIFFAGLGLPGLCGFPGEVFVVLSVFKYSKVLAVISAAVVILTAGYILWAIQRVFLGAEYKGPHADHLTPSTARENLIAGVIFAGAIVFGVLPYHVLLRYMEPTVTRQVNELAEWTKRTEYERANRIESTRVASQDFDPLSGQALTTVEPR